APARPAHAGPAPPRGGAGPHEPAAPRGAGQQAVLEGSSSRCGPIPLPGGGWHVRAAGGHTLLPGEGLAMSTLSVRVRNPFVLKGSLEVVLEVARMDLANAEIEQIRGLLVAIPNSVRPAELEIPLAGAHAAL